MELTFVQWFANIQNNFGTLVNADIKTALQDAYSQYKNQRKVAA